MPFSTASVYDLFVMPCSLRVCHKVFSSPAAGWPQLLIQTGLSNAWVPSTPLGLSGALNSVHYQLQSPQ